jgi:hypothetical protein
MSGNSQPQFTRQGNIGSVLAGGAALTTSDGSSGTIGTNIFVAFTADATNGSYVDFLRLLPVASSAGTSTNATTVRIYVSSVATGSTTTSNTYLIAEQALPIIVADQTTTADSPWDIPLGFRLPAGYTLLVSCHEANAANTAIRATVFGGDY